MSTASISIRTIEAEDTYSIRQEILRPGRSAQEVHFKGDKEESSVHLGAFLVDRLEGIASLVQHNNKNFDQPRQYQLRGMAVLPEVQGLGVGQKLLHSAEVLLKEEKKVQLLWCNARESAVEFYRKLGYRTYGDFFEIPDVCTHIVMYKEL